MVRWRPGTIDAGFLDSHASRATPPATPARPALRRTIEIGLVLAVCWAVALFRFGSDSLRGLVWAEDGQVFLQAGYTHSTVSNLTRPYNGYGHLVARLLISLIVRFPIAWHGVLCILLAALTQALVATFVYVFIQFHTMSRIAAGVVALAVSAVPVGPEVILNLANLQWFLVVAGCLAPLWAPPGIALTVVSAAAIFAAATSSVFGTVCVALALGLLLISRRRHSVVVAAAGTVGLVVQAAIVVGAPTRHTHPGSNVRTIPPGYFARVVNDGFLGIHHYRAHGFAIDTLRGAAIAAVIAIVMVHLIRRNGSSGLTLPLALLVLSGVMFVLPWGISGTRVGDGFTAGRYNVAAYLLLMCALALVAAEVLRTGRDRPDVLAKAAVVTGAIVLCVNLAASWMTPGLHNRRDGISWSTLVADGRNACQHHPKLRATDLAITPAGWFVRVPCRRLT